MIFLLMSPFFIIMSLVMFFISFLMLTMQMNLFVHWFLYKDSFLISFPLFLDFTSCMFMAVVFFISGSIIMYCEVYMESETYKLRFFFLMFLFVMSMVFLILSPNLISMLLGWDGLGLISFCLVVYYQNFKSNCSGMITALTNRVGDVFILISISIMFCDGSFSYMNFLNITNKNLLLMFFFIASMTKSAQIPFSAWLPAAMAAPTPVSSLVHSSTLVTAGVYIMIRFSYHLTKSMMYIIFFVSLLTTIMSGISGMLEFDFKKIIALSTLSQLGFMMGTVGLGMKDLAFFHLITHASFKALLFMCAGVFIHNFFDLQDIRGFGFLNKNYWFVLCMFNTANLSLCGFPFLSGFFSKDLILELIMLSYVNFFFFFLSMIGAFLTVFYSFRLSYYLTYSKTFYFKSFVKDEKVLVMEVYMLGLYVFSISLGYMGSVIMFSPVECIILPLKLKIFLSLICLMSCFISIYISEFYMIVKGKILLFLVKLWFLKFTKTDFLKPILYLMKLPSKLNEKLDKIVFGMNVMYILTNSSYRVTKVQVLKVYFILMAIPLFLICFLVYYFMW